MHFDAKISISQTGRHSISRLIKLFCSIIKTDFATTEFDVVSKFPHPSVKIDVEGWLSKVVSVR